MKLDITVVDAFTEHMFQGNPAAVIITERWLPDALMQSIAAENNLSETAFLVATAPFTYQIRWFSPLTEIAFCGHATLASAFTLFEAHPGCHQLHFWAQSVGSFSVEKEPSGLIQMDFPNNKPEKTTDIPEALIKGLSIRPAEVYENTQAYFAVYESVTDVMAIERDNALLKQLKPRDVVVTAPAPQNTTTHDFVSRYFWPANGGDEDPVTGSIHTGLAPFWAERSGKSTLVGYQASQRGGLVHCTVSDRRVIVSGHAVTYMKGSISLPA